VKGRIACLLPFRFVSRFCYYRASARV